MKKFILLAVLLLCGNMVLAEKYPVKLVPAQNISTSYNEIETGDKIKFKSVNDVYKNDKLYMKSGTPVTGIVDYIDENGWAADHAEIQFKQFQTKDLDGKKVQITSPITINGFEELKYRYPKIERFFQYLSAPVRGKEIDIDCHRDKSTYTIWLSY